MTIGELLAALWFVLLLTLPLWIGRSPVVDGICATFLMSALFILPFYGS